MRMLQIAFKTGPEQHRRAAAPAFICAASLPAEQME
jgi:hypothetical protein